MTTSLLQFNLYVHYVPGTVPEKGSFLDHTPQDQRLGVAFSHLPLPEGIRYDEGRLSVHV